MSTVEVTRTTTVQPVTRRDVLHRAADLLEEFGWCQFFPAKDGDGWPCLPCESRAQSFCLSGAAERAIFDLYDGWNYREQGEPPGLRVRPGRGKTSLCDPAWNNAPERTKAEVVARLRTAAEKTA